MMELKWRYTDVSLSPEIPPAGRWKQGDVEKSLSFVHDLQHKPFRLVSVRAVRRSWHVCRAALNTLNR